MSSYMKRVYSSKSLRPSIVKHMDSNEYHVLIDANHLGHRAFHTTGNLRNGVVFGFLQSVLFLMERLETHRLIFMWDSKHSLRRELFAGYKAGRRNKVLTDKEKKDKDEMYRQFHVLRKEILPLLGFRCVCSRGYEADDMIASAVATNPLSPFVIVSGDADLYQLLRYERVIMFIPRSNALYTSSDFEEEYGIKPSRWSRVKAMAGCSSDDIPPVIPRVGEKTVIKFLTDRLTPARSKALKTQFETEDNMMIYTRNKFLTILPYVKTPPVVLEEMSLSLRAFRDVCLEYEFPSLLEEEHRWRDIIKKQ